MAHDTVVSLDVRREVVESDRALELVEATPPAVTAVEIVREVVQPQAADIVTVGVQGPEGAQGPSGPSGPAGPAGATGPAGVQNLFIGPDAPLTPPASYLWIETGLGLGEDMTFWVESGA